MANSIGFDEKTPPDESLPMSNGATDVFINVLLLSGSAMAQTESEKRLIAYLAEKDQKIGMGTVGFDIVDMPWDHATFEADKSFMLNVINGVRNKIGWEKLWYTPDESRVLLYMDGFERLINKMTEEDIRRDALSQWLDAADENDPIRCGFPKCAEHDVFLTWLGCQICNS